MTALIKPSWCVLLYCFACLYHSLIVVQPSWTTVSCPTTKLSLLISKSFVGTKQSVISVALKAPLKTWLGICIYNTLLPHRADDYIGITSSCPPHILQQNCAHELVGAQNRSFHKQWLNEFTWLAYSNFYNGAFCKWCFVFAPQTVSRSAKPPGSLVSGPHCNYKKAKEHYNNHQNCH